ncbi:MAG: endolytic transglycosylase MltG [Rhodobacteraceae bacterium]|nr:endolytic transglycosylase MltG [Paracoccaceae bacterium]
MWKSVASNALTFLVVVLFLLGGVILWGQSQYTSDGPLAEAICLRVERGSNMMQVSRDLEREGAITSGAIFRLGADYTERTDDLKAGSFLVAPGASMAQILDQVTRGGASTCGTEIVYRIGVTRTSVQVRELDPARNAYVERASFNPAEEAAPEVYGQMKTRGDTRYRIALAEGVTSWQIVEGLKAMDILTGTVEAVPAEGMLAPDSYEVRNGTARAEVLARMAEQQRLRIAATWENRTPGLPLASPEEMLILASIIEKETGVPEERRQVASVFVNRLNRGMRLQTDPTVIYGITRGEGVLGRGLRQSELRAETPWNTYVINGLPPTPIANPGLASLRAAVDPDGSDYIFFVADGTGGHAFAETLDQHNRNVARWRAIEAERANSND